MDGESVSNRKKPARVKVRPELRPQQRYVDTLRPGAIIVGTGPSGLFSDGPHMLKRLELAPEHSVRTDAYWLRFTDGTDRCLYGDAVVEVAS